MSLSLTLDGFYCDACLPGRTLAPLPMKRDKGECKGCGIEVNDYHDPSRDRRTVFGEDVGLRPVTHNGRRVWSGEGPEHYHS